jgi:hypothetical protein
MRALKSPDYALMLLGLALMAGFGILFWLTITAG